VQGAISWVMWQLISQRALKGYYTAVSMTLNVAEVPMPEGQKYPLKLIK
jgi:hypothetical protein